MTDTDIVLTPAFLINDYVWELVKANTNLTEADYGGRTPFVPGGQDIDLADYNRPIFVYGYGESVATSDSTEVDGTLMYVVYETDFRLLTKVLNLIQVAFGKDRDGAGIMNDFTTNSAHKFPGIRFGSIFFSDSEGGGPEETEGGRLMAGVTLKYCYFSDPQIKQWNGTTFA